MKNSHSYDVIQDINGKVELCCSSTRSRINHINTTLAHHSLQRLMNDPMPNLSQEGQKQYKSEIETRMYNLVRERNTNQ